MRLTPESLGNFRQSRSLRVGQGTRPGKCERRILFSAIRYSFLQQKLLVHRASDVRQ